MCTLMAALTIVSGVVSAAGQMQQAKAQAAAANYNAKLADVNARVSMNKAKDALERGQDAEQQQRLKTAGLMGKQQAAMAANGVDLGFGSPLDTMIDTATMGELDALTVRQNAARESYDYRVQASNQTSQGVLSRMEAKSAKTGGFLAATGTLLGSAGGAYKSWYNETNGGLL